MCGIVGYVGRRQAVDVLLEGLKRLEYRGCDSTGVVVQNGKKLVSEKCAGRTLSLALEVKKKALPGRAGLGHTRWATHGRVTRANAHPHFSCDGRIAVVHNGIIENFSEIRDELDRSHAFQSDTDTEVIPHLIEELYARSGGDLVKTVREAVSRLRGSLGIGVVHADHPDTLCVARVNGPMHVGVGEGESFIASDIPALLPYTRRIIALEEGELALIDAAGVQIFDRRLQPRVRKPMKVVWTPESAEKNGHSHFMSREIADQARTLSDDARAWDQGMQRLKVPRELDRIVVVACGSSLNAGFVAKTALEETCRIPVDVTSASEFRYGDPLLGPRTLAVALSQSGETADTLAALRQAKAAGSTVLAMTNARNSTLAREADQTVYMQAGPEIGVAATKTYTSLLMNILQFALYFGRSRGTLPDERFDQLSQEARRIPSLVESVLRRDALIRACAKKFQEERGFMFIGRRYNYATALEGALKIKELTWRPAEAHGAGDLKYGPLALVDERTVCVAIAPKGRVNEKMITNIGEVRARGGRIVAVATEGDLEVAQVADHVFEIPACEEMFSPILAVIPLQLLAYHQAVGLGRNADRSRYLAKSVTSG